MEGEDDHGGHRVGADAEPEETLVAPLANRGLDVEDRSGEVQELGQGQQPGALQVGAGPRRVGDDRHQSRAHDGRQARQQLPLTSRGRSPQAHAERQDEEWGPDDEARLHGQRHEAEQRRTGAVGTNRWPEARTPARLEPQTGREEGEVADEPECRERTCPRWAAGEDADGRGEASMAHAPCWLGTQPTARPAHVSSLDVARVGARAGYP